MTLEQKDKLIKTIDALITKLDKDLDKLDGLDVRLCMTKIRRLRIAREVVLELEGKKI